MISRKCICAFQAHPCLPYCSGEARFPATVFDVKAAIRILKANASKYNIDPKRVAIWVDSEGANIALVVATSVGVKEMGDPSMGNANQSSAVQVAVSDLTVTKRVRVRLTGAADSRGRVTSPCFSKSFHM